MWSDLKSFVERVHARTLTASLRREEGQALVEYSLILALVSVAGIAALIAIGGDVKSALETVEKALAGA
jgi:Flp pilus assembly pilin Flp